ncbi:molecular chaperone TorD family protein [bacterium]|nr:molecular chaperone TorD family protein [bacterium]
MTVTNDPAARPCIEELCGSRAGVYRMFSSLYFRELTEAQVASFARDALPALEGVDERVAAGARCVRRSLARVTSGTREDLAVDYAHTFLAAGSTKSERRACPFESVYTSEDGLLMQEARDDVYRLMLGEHLEPDPALHVPEDHLAFEFDFMAALCDRLAEAAHAGDAAEALRLLDLQRTFQRDHQLNWVDKLCDAIEGCCRTDFYRGVSQMTRAFVHMQGELLDATAELLATTAPGEGRRGGATAA